MTVRIEVDMDKACSKCGRKGATQSGLCLKCIANNIRRTTPMSREYEQSQRIEDIGKRMINEHYPHLKAAQIAYVMKQRDPEAEPKPPKAPRQGKMIKIARARLVPQLYRLLTGYDFIVEADEVLWDLLSLEQQEAVVDHELCHCARDENGWYIRDHDVTEFSEIIERHGLYHLKLEEFISAAHQQKLPFEAQAAAGR